MMTTLLEMSLAGGILIAVIALVRMAGLHRLPGNAFLALWGLALCRLLIPVSIPSPSSVWTAVERLPLPVDRAGILVSQAGDAVQAAAGSGGVWAVDLRTAVWAAAALACALVTLGVHLRQRLRVRDSLPVQSALVSAWLEENRLRRTVRVRVSDRITSPLTYGLARPVILLPKGLDPEDGLRLPYVLSHELVHIRRFDVAWKALLAAAACIHWFNPLVWLMVVLANRDLELSCDAQVLRCAGRDVRADYARALVSLEERRAHFTPLSSSFARNALEERIVAIMKNKKTTIAAVAAALVLVGAVAAVFATGALDGDSPRTSSGSAVGRTPTTAAVEDVMFSSYQDFSDSDPQYTQAQYNKVVKALTVEGWQNMSIAQFNRTVHKILQDSTDYDGDYFDSLEYTYQMVLNSLPDSDPNAPYLCNTVAASLNEYNARLDEVTSGKTVDPSFSGYARRVQEQDVYGDKVVTHFFAADYSFTYRILDQDDLTVRERDAFLQAVMQGAQDHLDGRSVGQLIDDKDPEASFQAALEAAGKAASTDKIQYTGGKVEYYENA